MITAIIAALGVCAVITSVALFWIYIARNIDGPASIGAVQVAMFSKLMLGILFTIVIFMLTEIDPWVYSMTVGIYSCTAFPMLVYIAVKKDMT